jgi:acyl-CoA thioesterase-1
MTMVPRTIGALLLLCLGGGIPTAAGQNAAADAPVILAVGESTTAGYGVDRAQSYPAQLQRALDERHYRYRVVNHGVSGSTTGMALTRLDRGVALQPKIVIIALGGNDQGARLPLSVTRANVSKMVSMFKRIGAEVFLADRTLRGDTEANSETGSIFAAIAREHRAVLMPALLAGVTGHPELLLSDGSHPNAEGYTIVVRNVLAAIEPYLQKD